VPPIATTLFDDAENNDTIYIKVIENYGTPPTNQASATTVATLRFYKAKSKYTVDMSQYIGDLDSKLMTDFASKKLYNFGSQRISAIANDEEPNAYFDFRNSAGTQIKLESLSSVSGYILNMYFTYSNIKTIFGVGTFTDVVYFDFYLGYGAGNSESIRIYIDHSKFAQTFQK